ncbi:hypothetical protein EDB85DRAFT_1895061 [Lactarius pseudohatsudake]|nr:hypothetical protein EDB85DRAFT_1895061 [Lactarius pseudohatsudake]
MSSSSPLLQSPPSSSHHCHNCSRRRVVALLRHCSCSLRDPLLAVSSRCRRYRGCVPALVMIMWSWSVVGGVCDSGLPAAAAAIVVVMLGVAGSSEELKWVEYLCYSQQRRPGKGNAALNWVCVGTLSRVVVVANAAPEGGLGARVPAVIATPAVIVKAIVLGLRKCTTDLCECRKLPVKRTGVHAFTRDCPCQFHSTSVCRMQVKRRPHNLGIKVWLCCMELEPHPVAL